MMLNLTVRGLTERSARGLLRCRHAACNPYQTSAVPRIPRQLVLTCCTSKLDPSHPYPDPDEENSVSHEAFMKAMENSRPPGLRIKGLQEFAAAVWERRRRIPSQTYKDPLDQIFTEFDADSDGHLTAEEITSALQSRRVEISVDQVARFIEVVDANQNGTIERNEWAHFIFNMAVADLHFAAATASPAAAEY